MLFRSTLANYITSDLVGLGGGSDVGELSPESMASISLMVVKGKLSSRGAKDLLKILFEEGGNSLEVAESRGLLQKSNKEELKKLAEKIILDNQTVVQECKFGKDSSIQFLIGQAMKETRGSANPQILKDVFDRLLK